MQTARKQRLNTSEREVNGVRATGVPHTFQYKAVSRYGYPHQCSLLGPLNSPMATAIGIALICGFIFLVIGYFAGRNSSKRLPPA